jgi:hypothetical protein
MGNPKDGIELWMWDGATEYEGIFTRLDGEAFSARVRQARRPGASLGRRGGASSLDLHQVFTQRRFLAHFTGSADGTLLEAHIEGVQASSDADYEYLLSGRFAKLDEKQLAMLRKMSVENAALLLQRRVS